MSLLEFVEGYYKEQLTTRLQDVVNRYGLQLRVFRATPNVQQKVYGVQSGSEQSEMLGTIDAVLTGDDFFPSDGGSSGAFQEGWMYTTSPLPRTGDRVEIVRNDSRTFRFKIVSSDDVGYSDRVFKKYRLSALGD